jgi:Galactoside-binding lectin
VNNQHTADFPHRMPFNAAEVVTVKGEVNLTHVQIYPGMGGQHGQPWRFAMVRNSSSSSFFFRSSISSLL